MVENANTRDVDLFEKQKNKDEMKKQIVSFVMMLGFTLLAFALVASEVSPMFAIPTLTITAIVQVGFQFYYFMHLKDKGHGMPALLIYGGVWAALLVLAGLGIISWW